MPRTKSGQQIGEENNTRRSQKLAMPPIVETEVSESMMDLGYQQNETLDLRAQLLTETIEDDDLPKIKALKVTLDEIRTLRFEYSMNILQLVCHEESETILDWLTKDVLANEPTIRKELADYRDAHLGSQAIHLAATTGNLEVMKTLEYNYWVDFEALTDGN